MKEKLKIVMFGHKKIPSRDGGVEIVVDNLSRNMVKSGHLVTCLNRSGKNVVDTRNRNEKADGYYGVKIKNVPTLSVKGLSALSSSFFASIVASFGKYDVVHIHAEGPAFMCFLPKLFGKRVVVTVHGLDHKRAKWGRLAKWYIMAGEKNAVRFADEIIVLSHNLQEYFKSTYNRKTVFIPNGIEKPKTEKAEIITQNWGLEKDGYILFLGRLVPEKGLQYLINAYKSIKTDKKLVIAGAASDTGEFEEKIKKLSENNENIIFTGFVFGKILNELYSNAYIYVLPSDLEGMPISLLEAMSFGNCCLVSDIPECSEVVRDFGVTFQKSNTEDLAQKLKMLCDNPKIAEEYKKNASEYILKKYTWEDTVNKTLDVYNGEKE